MNVRLRIANNSIAAQRTSLIAISSQKEFALSSRTSRPQLVTPYEVMKHSTISSGTAPAALGSSGRGRVGGAEVWRILLLRSPHRSLRRIREFDPMEVMGYVFAFQEALGSSLLMAFGCSRTPTAAASLLQKPDLTSPRWSPPTREQPTFLAEQPRHAEPEGFATGANTPARARSLLLAGRNVNIAASRTRGCFELPTTTEPSSTSRMRW